MLLANSALKLNHLCFPPRSSLTGGHHYRQLFPHNTAHSESCGKTNTRLKKKEKKKKKEITATPTERSWACVFLNKVTVFLSEYILSGNVVL